jgi:hypothetical protein
MRLVPVVTFATLFALSAGCATVVPPTLVQTSV